jgi:hypothetical protein
MTNVPKVTIKQIRSLTVDERFIQNPHPTVDMQNIFTVVRRFTDVRTLKQQLELNTQELRTRFFLLCFYKEHHHNGASYRGRYVELLCWFIDHFPRSFVVASSDYNYAGTNFQRLKSRWLKQVRLFPKDVIILNNAANFLYVCADKYSEKFWARAEQIQPRNIIWPFNLTRIYKTSVGDGKSKRDRAISRKALVCWNKVLMLSRKHSNHSRVSARIIEETTIDVAELALKCGLLKEAKNYGRRLLIKKSKVARGLNDVRLAHIAHSIIGRSCLVENDIEQALDHLDSMMHLTDPADFWNCLEVRLAANLLQHSEHEAVSKYLQYYQSAYALTLQAQANNTHRVESFFLDAIRSRCKRLTELLQHLEFEGDQSFLELCALVTGRTDEL